MHEFNCESHIYCDFFSDIPEVRKMIKQQADAFSKVQEQWKK